MKKLLSIILTVALLIGTFALFTVSAEEAKAVSVDGTEKTLTEFVAEAEANDWYSGKTVKLLADLTLPAGTASIADFKGTLDGNGKSVSGLTAPLFAKLTGATVKDLTLNGTITYEGSQCGALACQSYDTVTLENVVNNCDISFTQTGSNASGAGLVGFSNAKIIVTDCVNNGDVAAKSENNISVDVGGIIGYVKGTGCEIVATRCVNNGKLTTYVSGTKNGAPTSNTGIIGGIAAWVTGPASFTKCLNTGALETVSPVSAGGHKVGGIAGVIAATGASFSFDTCVNTGNIESFCQAGGIIGEAQTDKMSIKYCYNFGDMTSGGDTDTGANTKTNSIAAGILAYQRKGTTTIEACANYGDIISKQNNVNTVIYSGGIVGWVDTAITIKNTSNYADVSSVLMAGGIIGYVKGDCAVTIDTCFVSETVTLPEGKLDGAVAGALIAKINAGTVTLTNTKHLSTVNTVSYTGTVKDAADSYAVETEAAWRADQAINYEGFQYSAAADGKFNVRLVASLSSLDYLNAGFEVIRVANGTVGRVNVEIKTVYESLTGFDEAGVQNVYKASEFGADYLAALTVKGISATEDVTLIVRPYLTSTEGAVIYGEAYTVAFANGAYVE
ncbi:MAG: hypothetical protein IJW55_04295 [Clostridia bacterium]|nr:hypothetical protein [Clostridia bacterium]